VLIGNCAEILKTLPSESVDCVVTSPPYWGLRDYKTEPLVWDGDADCEHEWGIEKRKVVQPDRDSNGTIGAAGTRGQQGYSKATSLNVSLGAFCQKCGAWRGQLGLEPTPQLYIQHLTAIFDEVKRVLKKTGTCWVNLGDSYAISAGRNNRDPKNARDCPIPDIKMDIDLPDKCLVQIPSRFALAMTDAGWILRNEIIWHKPNAMPSSVKDRFTVDFEKLFFFVKSKKYYFEQQFEPMNLKSIERQKSPVNLGAKSTSMARYSKESEFGTAKNKVVAPNENGRNKRTVWTITTRPYKGAHFAVFPPELVETPIKAGCPVGGVVLDPFGGSGTTAAVAKQLGRNSIMIELNPNYIPLMEKRVGESDVKIVDMLGGAEA